MDGGEKVAYSFSFLFLNETAGQNVKGNSHRNNCELTDAGYFYSTLSVREVRTRGSNNEKKT